MSSLTSATRRNLRSSGPLTCCGACRAPLFFSPTNASLRSVADDHCPGSVAAQRALGWSMDRVTLAESLAACTRTWHETSFMSHLYHTVVTWDWCWACLPAIFLTKVCNNFLRVHISCNSFFYTIPGNCWNSKCLLLCCRIKLLLFLCPNGVWSSSTLI